MVSKDKSMIYVGSWGSKEQEGSGKGIYVVSMDQESGSLHLEQTLELEDPGAVALSPDGKYLYAVNEICNGFDGEWGSGGGVTAMAVKEDGTLEIINKVPSLGALPCYIEVDPSGKYVFATIHARFDGNATWVKDDDGNYTRRMTYEKAGIAMFKVLEDGSVKPVDFFAYEEPGSYWAWRGDFESTRRGYPGIIPFNAGFLQTHPYAHCIAFDKSGLAFASDRGADAVYVLEIDEETDSLKMIDKVKVDLGQAPRHLALNQELQRVYMTNEMEATVTVFAYDREKKSLERIQTVAVADDSAKNAVIGPSDVHVHPSGKYLYSSARFVNTITVYDIDQKDGTIAVKQIYELNKSEPRGFNITADGRFLVTVNKDVNELETLKIADDGTISPTGYTEEMPTPCCVRIL